MVLDIPRDATHTPDVGHDIWPIILSYLRRPLPLPYSRPDRSALAQGDLARAARVCKAFLGIIIPILYRVVLTDNFPLLIMGMSKKVTTLQSPLFYTKNLYIEYRGKALEPTYLQYLTHPDLTHAYGVNESGKVLMRRASCVREVKAWMDTLAWFQMPGSSMARILPKLETLAISSIYGKLHGRMWNEYESLAALSTNDGSTIHEVLASSNIRHLCVADTYGPLSLPTPAHLPKVLGNFTQCLHFGGGDIFNPSETYPQDLLSLPLGRPVRWVSQYPSTADLFGLIGYMTGIIKHAVSDRRLAGAPHHPRSRSVDLEIYCSSARMRSAVFPKEAWAELGTPITPRPPAQPYFVVSDPEQKGAVQQNLDLLLEALRAQGGKYDSVKWFISPETPICLACGCGPPA
ncbi:uncharacterized protein MKK02DRAFT_39501 [Dioszegia hungarica]|uniref:Uncharacterized protein n=1 Tax=Dioszegia hungarica TaxID=4972 RepID=A0AA38LX37_9TREE|nr:uncharacterized protein MKK02DRAFT_39501 [Dioszegia hungarica]KAI9639210.1 hypothetical protein MKK02DRAFT_39501 [Dioszegia hungarica]